MSIETKQRCQSCGMPLGESFYGTNADGSITDKYCKFCFTNGEFTKPNQTLDEMIASSIENMTGELGMPIEKATELAHSFIPQLERWKE